MFLNDMPTEQFAAIESSFVVYPIFSAACRQVFSNIVQAFLGKANFQPHVD